MKSTSACREATGRSHGAPRMGGAIQALGGLVFLLACVSSAAAAESPGESKDSKPAKQPPPAPTFKSLDADADGKLSLEEFLGESKDADRQQRRRRFYDRDADTDEVLSAQEFASKERPQRAVNEFRYRDVDGDERVTEDEFVGVVPTERSEPAKRDFHLFDLDDDGSLTLEEFLAVPGILSLNDRGALPDPLVQLVDQLMKSVDANWKSWDTDADGGLSAAEFDKATLRDAASGLGKTTFADWDRDGDGTIGPQDARLMLEIVLGVRRPQGELTRRPSGRVVNAMAFKAVDRNGDDRLDFDECLKVTWEGKMAERHFRESDANGDGLVTFQEWDAMPYRSIDPVAIFLNADKDLDGQLSEQELTTGAMSYHRRVAQYVFPGFDDDKDGFLSLAEFRLTPTANLQHAWHSARRDTDNDGYLAPSEFQWDDSIDAVALVADYFARFDVNNDGKLDLDEYFFDTSRRDPRREFRKLDKDEDGVLTVAEFVGTGDDAQQAAARRNFSILDFHKDGAMSFEEFLNVPSLVPRDQRGDLPDPIARLVKEHLSKFETKWNDWDSDGNGQLNAEEFAKASLGEQVDGLESTELEDWDRNKDKAVGREECQFVLEVAFGLRRVGGELLRTPSGFVFRWTTFGYWDRDDDDRLSWAEAEARPEFKGKAGRKKFDNADKDEDEFLTFEEFKPFGTSEPLVRFWSVEKSLDGRIDRSEWTASLATNHINLGGLEFDAFDADEDGMLTFAEYRTTPMANPLAPWYESRTDADNDGLLDMFEFRWNDGLELVALTRTFFNRLDRNQDGRLDLGECPFKTQNARVKFQRRDGDGDEKLTVAEFASVPGAERRAKRDFAVFDVNRNGEMTFEEFLAIPGVVLLGDRGALPDPVVQLVAERMKAVETQWKSWDKDADGTLSVAEFETVPLRGVAAGLEKTTFADWDRDGDGQVAPKDARQTIEIALGVRRPQGEPLRTASGRVVNWTAFKQLDRNSDDRVDYEEHVKRGWEGKLAEPRFREADTNQDGFVTFKEWDAVPYRSIDPAAMFLAYDKDLDGQLNKQELVAGAQRHLKTLARYLLPGFDADQNGFLSLAEFQMTPLANLQHAWNSTRRDADNDGCLALSEFRWEEGIDAVALVTDYFTRFDVNSDGKLDLDEFFFQTSKRDPQREFRKLDTDEDGVLTVAEYAEDGGDAKQAAARRDFQLFDFNQDEKMALDEFMAVPSRVSPDQRTPLPDPVVAMVDSQMAAIEKGWNDWDADKNGALDSGEFFSSGFARSVPGLEVTTLQDWDHDGDGAITPEDCQFLLEISYGVRTLTGHQLRTKEGRVFNWMLFRHVDENSDERLSWDEFSQRAFARDRAQEQFEEADTNKDGAITYEEWAAVPSRAGDPIRDFVNFDKDFDGKLDRAELMKGTPVWQHAVAEYVFPGFDVDGDGFLSLSEYRMTPLANPYAKWNQPLRDNDNDGRLTKGEFHWGRGPELASLCLLYFDRFDTNDNGAVDLAELRFSINPAKAPRDVAFEYQDGDQDGRLSLDEVLGDAKPRGDRQTDRAYEMRLARSEEAFHQADTDTDGFLSRDEFRSEAAIQAVAPSARRGGRRSTAADGAAGTAESNWRMWLIVGLNIVVVAGVVVFVIRKTMGQPGS